MLTSRDATRHRRPGATINGYDASIDKHNMMNGTGRRVMNGTGHRSQVYDVDHLATFTVGTHHGVLYAEDGMRKLRVMENTTGIWTMRCQLLLDERQVVVIDKQTGEELERYHWGQVSDPTAIISHDRSEVFNNILLFTVHEEPSRSDPVSEMHIFQAGGHPAKEIVEDMKAAQLGQTIGVRTSRRQSPQQQISPRPAESRHMPLRSRPSRGTKMLQDALESQTTGTITDRSDFQIKVLNHCFDDIERFIIRLQVSAEAFRELGRRKASKHKTSGMLRMRATVPPAGDFMDVFAKFKLAFNLLGELKSLIRDPNAPEIVHFLFTPLALMVAASKDPTTHESNLASKVISPLLTRNAKDLLEYCLSTKEHDEWMRLGEAWTMCSDEWIGAVRPYYPQFGDGWQPAVALLDAMFDNQAHEAPIYSNVNRLNTSRNSSHGQSSPPSARYSGDSVGGIHDKPPLEQSTARNEPYVHRRRETTPEPPAFRSDLHKLDVPQDDIRPSRHHPANQHVSHHQHANHHSGSYQNPMYAPPNNYSAPNSQAHANYHLAPNHRHERVDRYSSDDEQLNFTERIRKNGTRCFEVRADRKAANKKELSVRRGEAVEILDDKKNWWLVRNAQGRKGFVPYTILRPWELHSDGEHTVQNSRGAEFSSAHVR